MDFRKRERQQPLQDDDSDVEMGEIGSNADSKEFGGKRIIMKGQVKQNHSEIEKRRRDKMNTYINELSSMIPMCNAMSRKLDKLTVLRMAVQHMRALRGGSKPVTESNYKPSFLSDEDLKNLVLESADGFLLVVGCDRGRILYVSDSVQKILSQPQSDLVGQSFFDLVHPKDMATVKDQVSFVENPPTDKPLDKNSAATAAKSECKQVPKQMCSGARRSFICRLKSGSKGKKAKGNVDESTDFYIMNRKAKLKSLAANDKKKYVVVHFTGYLKSWPPSGVTMEEDDEDQDSKNLSCLIAVGREVAVADMDTKFDNQTFPTEFVSRHSIDGKFIYVDQRVLPICGYLPQEMVGSSAYDYFHPQDLYKIAQTHKNTVTNSDSYTVAYRFMCKPGHYIWLKSKSTNFRNPWTKDLEFIICVNEIDLSKPNPIVTSNVPAGITHQRPILPAQSSHVQNADMVPGDSEHSRKTVRKVIETLQEDQGPVNMKRSRTKMDDVDDQASSTEAAQIGSIIAEMGQDRINPNIAPHSLLGPQAPNPNMVSNEMSNRQRMNPGPSTSSLQHLGESSSAVGGPMFSMFPAMNSPGMPEMSQPHLVEQLIGMQQAIESMERPGMHQNEETMAMFMNMLEADAGLGGDLNDILFESN